MKTTHNSENMEDIESEFARIMEDYKNAITYQQSDPKGCLITSRRIAEDICKQLVKRKISQDPGEMMLANLINKLKKANVLPRPIMEALDTVRRYGNLGGHALEEEDSVLITPDYAQACVGSLTTVVKWYFEEFQAPETMITELFPKTEENVSIKETEVFHLEKEYRQKPVTIPDAGKLQRLQNEYQELQQRYNWVSENIRSLTEDYHNETRRRLKLQLKRDLDKEQAERDSIEQEMQRIERQIEELRAHGM